MHSLRLLITDRTSRLIFNLTLCQLSKLLGTNEHFENSFERERKPTPGKRKDGESVGAREKRKGGLFTGSYDRIYKRIAKPAAKSMAKEPTCARGAAGEVLPPPEADIEGFEPAAVDGATTLRTTSLVY